MWQSTRLLTILSDHLEAYLMQCGQLVSVIPEYEMDEWGFELMLDREAFTFIPNGGKNYPVIVRRSKPACWKCGMIGHLALSCPEKNAYRFPSKSDTNRTPSSWISLLRRACNGPECSWHQWSKGPGLVSSKDYISQKMRKINRNSWLWA